jgi:hypothetical protein
MLSSISANRQKKKRKVQPSEVRVKVIKISYTKIMWARLVRLKNYLATEGLSKLVLSCNSPYKTKWDLFVMCLATYNCFQIPLEVAFDPPVF